MDTFGTYKNIILIWGIYMNIWPYINIYIYMLMMGDGIENWDIAGISFWKITVIYTNTQS